jgi:hypothetical protein
MPKTRIPIEHIESPNNLILSQKKTQFVVVLLVAALSGFVLGSNAHLPLDPSSSSSSDPSSDTRLLLGAVSEGTPKTPVDTDAEQMTNEDLALDTSAGGAVLSDALIAMPEVVSPTPPRSREELELSIRESESAISKDTSEVTRIRDASIALVGEFDTNCGDWSDDCARYYVTALEKNNTAYNALVQKIEREERALADAKDELSFMR